MGFIMLMTLDTEVAGSVVLAESQGAAAGHRQVRRRAAAGVKTVMSVRADIWDYGMGTADLSQKITIALHLAINILMCRGETIACYLLSKFLCTF